MRIKTVYPKQSGRGSDLKTSRLTIVMCSLLFALAEVIAQTPPSDATLTTNPVFRKNCVKCHGGTAEGRHFGGPSLISEKATSASADELRNIITNGKGRMPKYRSKLSAEDINTLVEQIKAQQIKANKK